MSQSISMPAACTQEWLAMQSVSGGRHCVSCQRLVHDFTQFSDAELVAWFANHTGPTCGRFRSDQLDLPLYTNQPAAPTGVRGWVRWALALVLGWQTARAQNALLVKTAAPQTVAPASSQQPVMTPDSVLLYIRGQVIHDGGKPATVHIKKGHDQTLFASDSTGHFTIPIYLSDQRNDVVLLNFGSQVQVWVSTREERPPITITLKPTVLNTVIQLPPGLQLRVGAVTVNKPGTPTSLDKK
ncbi:hypothetical protein [Fibrella forsythiae]|uniref:Carboxypeptidase regulatory-like domain-containing protein n=1 Tax=Fibrella forsythiae TaxID=2817061 RepID=A0ABS3JMW8_9BACT|nr:hypothetical protein [Fibrella forsythiae]MBO0950237.1 hypothetical protein [Fibrella forsythiae]